MGNPELMRRPGFPAPILPIVAVMSHLIHFLAGASRSGAFPRAGRQPVDECNPGAAISHSAPIPHYSQPGIPGGHFSCQVPGHTVPAGCAAELLVLPDANFL